MYMNEKYRGSVSYKKSVIAVAFEFKLIYKILPTCKNLMKF